MRSFRIEFMVKVCVCDSCFTFLHTLMAPILNPDYDIWVIGFAFVTTFRSSYQRFVGKFNDASKMSPCSLQPHNSTIKEFGIDIYHSYYDSVPIESIEAMEMAYTPPFMTQARAVWKRFVAEYRSPLKQ